MLADQRVVRAARSDQNQVGTGPTLSAWVHWTYVSGAGGAGGDTPPVSSLRVFITLLTAAIHEDQAIMTKCHFVRSYWFASRYIHRLYRIGLA
jgi:hypothetical protein